MNDSKENEDASVYHQIGNSNKKDDSIYQGTP
jgi:hypothetical protein